MKNRGKPILLKVIRDLKKLNSSLKMKDEIDENFKKRIKENIIIKP